MTNPSLILPQAPAYDEGFVYAAEVYDGPTPIYNVLPLNFTRSNDTATRVNSAGLIEKVRTNLALYSEQFDNASWTKSSATITANATTAPDGTTTADNLIEDTSTGQHRVFLVAGVTGSHTFSVYVKSNGRQYIALGAGNTGSFGILAYFDIEDGVLGTVLAGTAKIENAGNGWYRCSVSGVGNGAGTSVNIYLANSDNSNTYTGDGTSGIYIWGAQLETGDIATDYILTTTTAVSVGPVANVPRLDYSGGGCPKLLLEPQRTNLIKYSEQFDNASWTTSNASVTSGTISPDGTANAFKLVESSTSAIHYIKTANITVSNSTTYTMSFFAKKGERNIAVRDGSSGSFVSIDLTNNLVLDSLGLSTSIELISNGWYRIDVSYLSTSTICAFQLITLSPSYTSGSPWSSYTGDGTSGVYIYGAQLEEGSYVSSYIPTLGAAVTRGADACSKTGISSLIGQTEGVILLHTKYLSTLSTSSRWFKVYGTSNEIGLALRSDNSVRSVINGQSDIISTAPLANTGVKIAWAYNASGVVLFVNGVEYALPNGGSEVMSSLDSILFDGDAHPGLQQANINQFTLFKTRLTNTQLAELTTL